MRRTDTPYQNLINMYLSKCTAAKKHLTFAYNITHMELFINKLLVAEKIGNAIPNFDK